MKRMKLVVLAIGMIGLLTAGNALAADTATLTVTASVLGTCSFNDAAPTMDFGSIDPTATGPANATTTLNFTCTNGTGWSLDDISGSYTMDDGGTNTLAYTIVSGYTTSGTGTGGAQTVDISGTIADTDYQGAVAASYSDTLTINITP